MNELKVFENEEFGQVRVVEINGEPHFVLKDICDVLGVRNSRDVADRLDDDEKGVDLIDTLGGRQEMTVINESGLYNVILRSDKPQAKQFKKWITSDVLPSIRKHGAYMTDDAIEKALTDPDFIIRLATELKEERSKREAAENRIEADKPKIEFFDAVADSKDAIDIGSAAKVLNMGIGRNRLFEIMRENRILMDNNQPYQNYIDRGYFRTIEQKYTKPDGTICISIKTLVYQKGLEHIRKVVNSRRSA